MHEVFGIGLSTKLLLAIAACGIAAVLVLALLILVIARRRRQRAARKAPKPAGTFQERWQQDVQRLCGKSATWPLAVANADKLLEEALKKRRLKGKTTGERLVSAQRRLSDNDGVWFGHKLANKITQEDAPDLNKEDVMTALRGLRQAMKDLGVLQ